MTPDTAKVAVLIEMVALYAGGIVNLYEVGSPASALTGASPGIGTVPTDLFSAVLSEQGMRKAIACGALLAVLTAACDLGFPGWAALFGLIIVVAYALSSGGSGAIAKAQELQRGIVG